jgi:hypothetical protein
VNGGSVAVVELAGAFEDDVAALPVKLLRVVGGEDLHRAAAEVHRVARDAHIGAETAMDAVVAQQVGVRLDRAGGVDLDHLHVVAGCLGDMGERAAPDAAETVDANRDRHETRLSKMPQPPLPMATAYKSMPLGGREKSRLFRMLAKTFQVCANIAQLSSTLPEKRDGFARNRFRAASGLPPPGGRAMVGAGQRVTRS